MRRREVIAGLGAAAFAAPLEARAQQPTIPIIGFLSGRSRAEVGPALAEFHRGLGDLGFVEGKNVVIDYQWAEGRYDRLPGLAAALVERPVMVIAATGGNTAALAAKAATSTVPIVFTLGGDPVTMGLVSSLNQPGGNATGVTLFITELGAKRFELLRELAPKAARIAVLVNPNYPSGVAEARDVQARGPALGLDVDLFNAATGAELEPAFASIAARKMDALLTAADPFLIDLRHRVVRLAADQRLPAVYHTRDFAEAGGLMSYGASIGDGYYTNGSYVGQILKGARPAALPVQQPTKVELVINLKTARALGLAFPLPLLGRADEVMIAGLGRAAVGWPLVTSLMSPAAAQVRRPQLAMLLVAAGATSSEGGERRDALAELGWVDGRTIDIVLRYADGALDRVPALIDELVALNPDVILTHTGEAARAAARATRTIPVVVGAAGEEVMVELAGGNLARPIGNVIGLTLVSHEQHAKVLELLKQAHPAATRIGILANPLGTAYRDYPASLSGALGLLGLYAVRVAARDQPGLEDAFATMAAAQVDAVLVTADPNFNRPVMRLTINELARRHRIAVVSLLTHLRARAVCYRWERTTRSFSAAPRFMSIKS